MNTPVIGDSPPLIEWRAVKKIYREGSRERVVLDGIDARVMRGEFVALLGRSGSGKSTFLNLASGIDLPTAGAIVIDGIDLTRQTERERTLFRRKHIGFIFQFFNLIPTLTVAENVRLPLDLAGTKSAADDARKVADMLEAVGLGDRADSFPDRLSGGEQQRVAIARTLAQDPLLVLADEPTGNLDAETGERVLGLIDRLCRHAGHTVVMATHSGDVAALADRVWTIRDGHLSEQSGADYRAARENRA